MLAVPCDVDALRAFLCAGKIMKGEELRSCETTCRLLNSVNVYAFLNLSMYIPIFVTAHAAGSYKDGGF